ncbi:transmembrane protein, putative (macronuclear) [Tetrahymena thermophila SB210]|uniref:Transmembrane protein, putative n=1 Tax=Tetrahymena thermophila (strain SB210) TaxID=312017 RepID=W7XII1_TETTS|nr:transmembrane protein, putative [Tetrahymena thermophila SB210]EWS73299.1 transmembrane protein, putative [Tetrahymena thermophila SB210]|eukprot:XP_012654148.1 transmembrane protein, putative [Tetrahymena thermophila SB210]
MRNVRTTYKYAKGAILEAFSNVSAFVAKYQPRNPFKDNKVMIKINFSVISYQSSLNKIKTEDVTIETMQQYCNQVPLFIQKSTDNFLITVEADAIETLAKRPKVLPKYLQKLEILSKLFSSPNKAAGLQTKIIPIKEHKHNNIVFNDNFSDKKQQAKKFVHIGFVFMSTTASDIFIIEKQQNIDKVEQAPLIPLNNTNLNASFFSTQVGFLFILQRIILIINPIIILMFIIQSEECSDLKLFRKII